MHRPLLPTIALLIALPAAAQRFIGLEVVAGEVRDQSNTNFPMATNADGEVYCAMPFYGSITIGGATLNPVQGALDDIALVKLTPNGEVMWAKAFGGNNGDIPQSLAVDGLGQVYVSWKADNGVSFYFDETGTTTDFPNIGAPFYGFTCFSPEGLTLWHRTGVFGLPVVTASTAEPGVFSVDQGAIRRFNAQGDVLWQTTPQPQNALVPLSAQVAGARLAIGAYCGNPGNTLTVDTVTISADYLYAGAVFLMDTSGSAIWGRGVGNGNGTYAEYIRNIAIDPLGGSVYCGLDAYTGSFSFAGSTLVNPAGVGNNIAAVLKYDHEGNELWGRFAASVGFSIQLHAMTLDADGSVHFGGKFGQSPVVFGSISLPVTTGQVKSYLAKLSADGDAQWFKYEPSHSGPGVNSIMRSLMTLADGSFLSANYFWSSFFPPVKTGCLQAPNPDALGMYFSRLDPNDSEPFPNAMFTYSMSGNLLFARAPEQVVPATFAWTFGDGGTATGGGVAHVYPNVGSYQVCLTASNTCGTAQHCQFVDHPGLRAIEPRQGGQGAVVSALALGGGFVPGSTFRLTRAGEADIIPSGLTVGNTATLFGRLDLQGAALGLWNVVASIPGLGEFTLPDAFEVAPLRPARMKVHVTGPELTRTFLWAQFNVRVSNVGNEDAVLVPLHIELPEGVEVEWLAEAIGRHSVPNLDQFNDELDQVGGNYDVLRFSSPGYGITRLEMIIPVVGGNSYNDYIVRLRSFTPMHIVINANVRKPLIGSRALADATVQAGPSPYTNYMEVAAEWLYDRTYPRSAFFAAQQTVIREYATAASNGIGGVGGWPFGSNNPPPGQVGGIGSVFGPTLGGGGRGFATPPVVIVPPRIYEWSQGPPTQVPPPAPPPPVGPPPPPPPVQPPPPTCGYNGCCAGSCGGFGADWPYNPTPPSAPEEVTPPENTPVELPPPPDNPTEPPAEQPPPRPTEGKDEPEVRQPIVIPPEEPSEPDEPNEELGCTTGCSCSDGTESAGMASCDLCEFPPEGSCGDEDDGADGSSWDPKLAASFDPNAIYGPRRNGDIYLNNYLDHAYTITFENLASATLPAQRVVVIDTLDLTRFDAHSFRFLTATIGDGATVRLEPREWNGNYLVDMTAQTGLHVGIHASYDPGTGIVRVEFMSIDPQTMAFPTDPLAGFLPPNVADNEGTGSLSFMVNYKGSLVHGDAISTRAIIYFDDNEPIVTNTYTNILDRVKPTGQVQLVQAISPASDTVMVVMTGADDLSGLAYQHLFISVNGHGFRKLISSTQDTIGYKGFAGENLRFFGRAVDKAGNVEDYPVEFWNNPDAAVDIAMGLADRTPQARMHVHPNPARDAVTCVLSLPASGDARIELLNALGEVVVRPLGQQPARMSEGEHRITVPVHHLAPGAYLLKVTLPNGASTAKIMVEQH